MQSYALSKLNPSFLYSSFINAVFPSCLKLSSFPFKNVLHRNDFRWRTHRTHTSKSCEAIWTPLSRERWASPPTSSLPVTSAVSSSIPLPSPTPDPLSLVQDFLSAQGNIAHRVDGMGNSVTKQPSRQLLCGSVGVGDLPLAARLCPAPTFLCGAEAETKPVGVWGGWERGRVLGIKLFWGPAGDSATSPRPMMNHTGCDFP